VALCILDIIELLPRVAIHDYSHVLDILADLIQLHNDFLIVAHFVTFPLISTVPHRVVVAGWFEI